MIASLRGRVLEVHAGYLILEVNGVGYQIKASASVLAKVHAGDERLFYIHDHVREDVRDLYGFVSSREQEFFEKLLAVSGVGPKVALTIMSVGQIDQVKSAVMRGDLALLTSVPGVGTKTAQKIVLELKGQLVEADGAPEDSEVVDALVSLGYSAQQARAALKSLPHDLEVPERVRQALKYLGRK
ncbi:MAG: Holliday junction branch migration protein RuvA [Patescibacteria group bacterium]